VIKCLSDSLVIDKRDATDEQLWESLQSAIAKAFVKRLPSTIPMEALVWA
jgi:ABC-type multidrug transport system fused ATPase/permease subunit